MQHLITNLSAVASARLHGAIAAHLDPLSPEDRADRFASVMGRVAGELDLRAVVEFARDKVHATFLDVRDEPAIAFHLAERRAQRALA